MTPPSAFCISGLATNGTCNGVSYNKNFQNMTTPSKDGLIQCSISSPNTSLCLYADNQGNNSTRSCQCSYDSQGRSFCPKGYDETNSNWKLLASSKRTLMSSKQCHAMTRFSCWDTPKNAGSDLSTASLNTVDAAQFFYADSCIKKLFDYTSAGEFIKLSFVILAALFVSLL